VVEAVAATAEAAVVVGIVAAAAVEEIAAGVGAAAADIPRMITATRLASLANRAGSFSA
jgi:hypothetical protein